MNGSVPAHSASIPCKTVVSWCHSLTCGWLITSELMVAMMLFIFSEQKESSKKEEATFCSILHYLGKKADKMVMGDILKHPWEITASAITGNGC